MVLQTISLKEGIQKSVGQLVKISNIPLILFISLTTIYITMAVMGILELKYLYFAIAGFDFIIASALFISLKMMQRVIAKVPTLKDFLGEVLAFVGVEGTLDEVLALAGEEGGDAPAAVLGLDSFFEFLVGAMV